MSKYIGEIKSCPCCGHQPFRDNLIDSLHPTGSHFTILPETEGGFRHYWAPHNYHGAELPRVDGDVWEFSCLESEGGCGLTIRGDSMEEVMEKWNRRAYPALSTSRQG